MLSKILEKKRKTCKKGGELIISTFSWKPLIEIPSLSFIHHGAISHRKTSTVVAPIETACKTEWKKRVRRHFNRTNLMMSNQHHRSQIWKRDAEQTCTCGRFATSFFVAPPRFPSNCHCDLSLFHHYSHPIFVLPNMSIYESLTQKTSKKSVENWPFFVDSIGFYGISRAAPPLHGYQFSHVFTAFSLPPLLRFPICSVLYY